MQQVGRITQNIITILGLSCGADTPIFMGESNIAHMESSHPQDYAKYGGFIGEILAQPDYIGINPADRSIEYVKEFSDYVKVAVRVANSGRYYARSLYVLNPNRVRNFVAKGTLKKI